jgi:hypothetical protein
VFPTGNAEPDAGVETTVALQLSVAVTLKFTTLLQAPAATIVLIFDGQVITGDELSTMITLNEQVVTFPDTSVAVYVTGVVPIGKVEPGA